jgi:DNA-binding NarL/FixJ family response regulator
MSEPKKRVLVVDDHEVVLTGIISLLEETDRYELAGTARNGREAIESAASLSPDMVIMDISMPEVDGIQATTQIRRISPDTKILVYTMHSDAEWVLELFKAGISGYVLKDHPISDLRLALEAVESGGTYFSSIAPSIITTHLDQKKPAEPEPDLKGLSKRELEIFKALADGRTVKEVAEKLYISPRTVETHKYNVMKKLGVGSMADLTKLAIKMGMIEV